MGRLIRLSRRRLLAQKSGPRILNINCWNEWTEGSYLEPDTVHGMKYLEAVHEVFGDSRANVPYYPTNLPHMQVSTSATPTSADARWNSRDESTGYREVTTSTDPAVLAARNRFAAILQSIRAPDRNDPHIGPGLERFERRTKSAKATAGRTQTARPKATPFQ